MPVVKFSRSGLSEMPLVNPTQRGHVNGVYEHLRDMSAWGRHNADGRMLCAHPNGRVRLCGTCAFYTLTALDFCCCCFIARVFSFCNWKIKIKAKVTRPPHLHKSKFCQGQ